MKTTYEVYFHKFSKIVYANNLSHIQKQFNLTLSFAIEITYISLYISAYRDNHFCLSCK